jgi:hypothetical protein
MNVACARLMRVYCGRRQNSLHQIDSIPARRFSMFQRIKCLVIALVVLAVTFAAGSAFAGDTGSVATMDEPTRLMSITFSPIHLAFPVLEVTAEFKAHERWGVAIVGGGGSMTAEYEVIGTQTWDVWELGGQFRYYALGDFDHGLQLGAEILYVNVSSNDIETSEGTFSGMASGIGVGPFLGYKIATDVGFTFDAQLGVQRVGIGAEAEHQASGTTATEEESDWGTLLNLNVGWSF